MFDPRLRPDDLCVPVVTVAGIPKTAVTPDSDTDTNTNAPGAQLSTLYRSTLGDECVPGRDKRSDEADESDEHNYHRDRNPRGQPFVLHKLLM